MSASSPRLSKVRRYPSFLSNGAMEQIRDAAFAGLKRLPKRGAEIGGLLTAGESQIIDGVEIISSEYRYGPSYHLSPKDLDQLTARAGKIRASADRHIAGFFRSSIREAFDYAPEDVALIRELLPDCKVLLLAKPFQDSHAGMRVFELNVIGEWCLSSEFEVDAFPSDEEPTTSDGPLAVAAASVQPFPTLQVSEQPASLDPIPFPIRPEALPVASSKSPHVTRTLPWRYILPAILFLCAVATILTLFLSSRSSRPSPRPQLALGLQVEPVGSALRVSWDRNLETVRASQEGNLHITDGSQERDIRLDSAQLTAGGILYRSASSDINFRLEVRGANGTSTVESVRVVDGSKPTMSVASIPLIASQLPATKAPSPRIAPEPTVPHTEKANAPPAVPAVQSKVTPAITQPVVHPEPRKGSMVPLEKAPVLEASDSTSHLPEALQSLGQHSPAPPPDQTPESTPTPNVKSAPAQPIPMPKQNPQPVTVSPPTAPTTISALSRAGYATPKPIRQVLPNRKLFGQSVIYGPTEIQVNVNVDENGRVTSARVATQKGSHITAMLESQALAAAKDWTFSPARIDGKPVAGTYLIDFHFQP